MTKEEVSRAREYYSDLPSFCICLIGGFILNLIVFSLETELEFITALVSDDSSDFKYFIYGLFFSILIGTTQGIFSFGWKIKDLRIKYDDDFVERLFEKNIFFRILNKLNKKTLYIYLCIALVLFFCVLLYLCFPIIAICLAILGVVVVVASLYFFKKAEPKN